MVTLCITLWGTAKLSFTGTVPFYIPIHSIWWFQFLHIFCQHLFFNHLKIVDVQWMWSDISLWFWCVSLMTKELRIFSCVYWLYISYLEKFLFKSFTYFFNWVVYLFVLSVRVLYIFLILPSYEIHDLQIISPICMLSHHFLDSVLWGTNIVNFDEVQVIYFFFSCLYFWYNNEETISQCKVTKI